MVVNILYTFISIYVHTLALFRNMRPLLQAFFLDLFFILFFSVNKWLGYLFLSVHVHLKMVIKVSFSSREVSEQLGLWVFYQC